MTTDVGLATDALRRHFRSLGRTSFGEGSSKRAVLELLRRRGYALHEDAPCRAGVLTLESYRAVKGTIDEVGLTAAAAVELHMEAAYALDDVSDSEFGTNRPVALAVALAVLAAGYSLACEAAHNVGRQTMGLVPLLDFHRNWSVACDGFLMDAHLQTVEATSLEVALEMTRRKSGALGVFLQLCPEKTTLPLTVIQSWRKRVATLTSTKHLGHRSMVRSSRRRF